MPATVQGLTTKALLDLYEARAQQSALELDLQRATAKTEALGRTSVGEVMAQLRAMAEKEQARKEKVAAEGQKSQAAATEAAAIPQVPVTGQPAGRTGSAKDALQLAGKLIGKGGPQPAGQSMPIGSGVGATVAAAGPGGASPVPAPVVQGGPPGSMQPVVQPLTGWERFARAAQGVRGLPAAVSGQEVIGYENLPSVSEVTAPFAKGIAARQAQMLSADPATSKAAAAAYQQDLDRLHATFSQQLGSDYADEAIETLEFQAANLRLEREEEERLKSEDPEVKARRDVAKLKSQLINNEIRLEDLTPGQLQALKLSGQGIGDIKVELLQPATKNELERRSTNHFDILNRLGPIETAAADYPEFFEYGAEKVYQYLQAKKKIGLPLTEEETLKIQRYAQLDMAFAGLKLPVVRQNAGATMAPHEVEMTVRTLPTKYDSYPVYKQKAADFRHLWALDTFRDLTMRAAGLPDDPALARSFADTAADAKAAAEARMSELQASGLSAGAAEAQTAAEFRGQFGLDLKRLFSESSIVGF